ncbi:MAG: hypothetical protein JNJ49_00600 [Bdellovibrionaceae bacterium]|nr:hypothetical protein [Pseudobdellovibrionaceae bacterium]
MSKLKRVLNQTEIEGLADELRSLQGAQLQEVEVEPSPELGGKKPGALRLGFFLPGGVRWVIVDYDVLMPALIVFPKGVAPRPLKKTKLRRPLELFLRSHFVGSRLSAVGLRVDLGRALDLYFGPERRLELHLFPHGRNVIAHATGSAVPTNSSGNERTIAEFKPMPHATPENSARVFSEVRTPQAIFEEWTASEQPLGEFKGSASGDPNAAKAASLDILIEKKRKALEKVELEIENKSRTEFRAVGEWLKAHQTLDVPSEWEKWIDRDRSLAENISRLFTEAKANDRKIEGTRSRAEALRKELDALSSGQAPAAKKRDGLLEAADARGRTYEIASDLVLLVGKNATENMMILRKAQPFDLWLHLRERPGAHGILRRARGRVVSDQELRLAGVKVAEQSTKKRAAELKGEAYDLLVVECRYVRPIKGDKNGRVHYTNDRVLRLKL